MVLRNDELYPLEGVIPSFMDMELFTVSLSGSTIDIPSSFVLNKAYPNPFNPSTTINFGIPKDGQVEISVYDISGRHITTITDEFLSAGYHTRIWDASSYASGVYMINMTAVGFRATQKIALVK